MDAGAGKPARVTATRSIGRTCPSPRGISGTPGSSAAASSTTPRGSSARPSVRRSAWPPTGKQTILEDGGTPLPLWSGIGVYTVRAAGRGYYAVVTTDAEQKALSRVVPGTNATTAPVEEQPGPIRPIKQADSRARGGTDGQGVISGTAGQPLHLWLHPSASEGGPAGRIGDYYTYFGSEEMGLRDGIPGIFSVEERREKGGGALVVKPRDAIEIDSPKGGGASIALVRLLRRAAMVHRTGGPRLRFHRAASALDDGLGAAALSGRSGAGLRQRAVHGRLGDGDLRPAPSRALRRGVPLAAAVPAAPGPQPVAAQARREAADGGRQDRLLRADGHGAVRRRASRGPALHRLVHRAA